MIWFLQHLRVIDENAPFVIEVPDALSRAYVANIHDSTLRQLHGSLCHPGVIRFHRFVQF